MTLTSYIVIYTRYLNTFAIMSQFQLHEETAQKTVIGTKVSLSVGNKYK